MRFSRKRERIKQAKAKVKVIIKEPIDKKKKIDDIYNSKSISLNKL